IEAIIKMGTVRLRLGEHVEAAQAFNRALELNDRILTAYVGLGVTQLAMGRSDDAHESFGMASDIEPNSTLLFGETARLQLMASAAHQVHRYLSPPTVAARPGGPLDNDVVDLIDTQRDNVRTALCAHPHHADLHYRLGLLLRHQGDLSGSIEAFREALKINPEYTKAGTKLGLALRESGRFDEAIEAFERTLQLDPNAIDLHYQLGLIFADRGEFALALDRFEEATAKVPNKVDYVANLALALANMGLLDRASATWQTLCDVAEYTREGQALLTAVSGDSLTGPDSHSCEEGPSRKF
ncbi:MAG: tetratricopeptide repeat protein, partial [Planctomycetes bacterium]|nr:tetratricopeptide repeat protein [Planctomycetota bacterium]